MTIEQIARAIVIGLVFVYGGFLGYVLGTNRAYKERDCSNCFLKAFRKGGTNNESK